MTIHPKKSEIMIITNKKFIGPLNKVKLGEDDIEVVAESKCLGVTIDEKISWKTQVVNATANMSKKIKQLKRFQSLSPQVLEKIYFRSILSAAIYGIAVLGSSTCLAPLERIHKRAAKIVYKLPKSVQDHKVQETVNWKSVEYMYKGRVACITQKLYYEKSPDTMKDLIERSKSGSMNLRDNLKVVLSRSRTVNGRNSFKHRAGVIR